jgi:hypothetical protein
MPNICGPSIWNLFHVTFPAPRILTWLPYFCKTCATLGADTSVLLHDVHRDNLTFYNLTRECALVGSKGYQAHFVTVRSLPKLAIKNYSDFYLVASM